MFSTAVISASGPLNASVELGPGGGGVLVGSWNFQLPYIAEVRKRGGMGPPSLHGMMLNEAQGQRYFAATRFQVYISWERETAVNLLSASSSVHVDSIDLLLLLPSNWKLPL